MFKMMVSDVDDTLLRKSLSEELKKVVKLATNQGYEFVLCSGRPTVNLLRLAKEFNDYGAGINYVAGFNGSEIINVTTKQVIASSGFEPAEVDEICNVLVANGIDYVIYRDDFAITNNIANKYANYEAELNQISISEHSTSLASSKILGLCDPLLTSQKISELQVIYPNLQINKSKPFFIEITKQGVNKGLAVNVLAKELGIELESIAVCGDGDNDAGMFELPVGYKYVVANGSENLKKLADLIIPSVDDNGVASQLMELIS